MSRALRVYSSVGLGNPIMVDIPDLRMEVTVEIDEENKEFRILVYDRITGSRECVYSRATFDIRAVCNCGQHHTTWTNNAGISNEGHSVACPNNPMILAREASRADS